MDRSVEKKFNRLMKKENLQEITEERFYAVICRDLSLPPGRQVFIYDKFRTKAERNKWYEEIGREVEGVHGVKMEMPENLMDEEEAEAIDKKDSQ